MDINVYKLGDDKKLEMIGGGGISIGKERVPIEQLVGTLAMQLRENNVIYFNINCGGRASFKTDEIIKNKIKLRMAKRQSALNWKDKQVVFLIKNYINT